MGIGDELNTFFNGGYSNQMYDSIIGPIKDALLTAFSSVYTWLEKEFNTITDFIDNEIVGTLNEGVNYIKQLPQ